MREIVCKIGLLITGYDLSTSVEDYVVFALCAVFAEAVREELHIAGAL